MTMLQTRPTSATGRMPSGQQQPAMSYAAAVQAPRSAYHGNGYRGSSTPIQQYAFTSTPSLNQPPQPQQFTPQRTSPTPQTPENDTSAPRGRFPAQTPSYANATQTGSRDDSAVVQGRGAPAASNRSQSAHMASAKAAPDRYRRGNAQPAPHTRSQSVNLPSTANLPNMAQFYGITNNARSTLPARPTSFYATVPGASMDDMHIPQQPKTDAKGLRRRSMQGLESVGSLQLPQFDHSFKLSGDTDTKPTASGSSVHSRNGSSESVTSSRSNHSRPSVSYLAPPYLALPNHIFWTWSHG